MIKLQKSYFVIGASKLVFNDRFTTRKAQSYLANRVIAENMKVDYLLLPRR